MVAASLVDAEFIIAARPIVMSLIFDFIHLQVQTKD